LNGKSSTTVINSNNIAGTGKTNRRRLNGKDLKKAVEPQER